MTREQYLEDSIRRAYNALPVTATPQEFVDRHGNWGLSESEYCAALILADALTTKNIFEPYGPGR